MTHVRSYRRRLHPAIDLAIYVSAEGDVETWLEVVGGSRWRLRAGSA